MNKVIFLDFDGTMIPTTFSAYMKHMRTLSKDTISTKDSFGEFFAPHCVDNLKKLIEITDAKIVFSTRWVDNGFAHIKKMWLSRYNFGEIAGYTPILVKHGLRGDQIQYWLDSNQPDNYVILDDMGEFQFHATQLSHLVQCDEKFGFTEKELKKAIEILK